jgi:hypothetical protein
MLESSQLASPFETRGLILELFFGHVVELSDGLNRRMTSLGRRSWWAGCLTYYLSSWRVGWSRKVISHCGRRQGGGGSDTRGACRAEKRSRWWWREGVTGEIRGPDASFLILGYRDGPATAILAGVCLQWRGTKMSICSLYEVCNPEWRHVYVLLPVHMSSRTIELSECVSAIK